MIDIRPQFQTFQGSPIFDSGNVRLPTNEVKHESNSSNTELLVVLLTYLGAREQLPDLQCRVLVFQGCSDTGDPSFTATSSSVANTQDEIHGFLIDLYTLVDASQERKAVQYVVSYVDQLMRDGQFDHCNDILLRVDVGRITSAVMVAFLGMTLRAKGRLPNRAGFFSKVQSVLIRERGLERTERLLKTYR